MRNRASRTHPPDDELAGFLDRAAAGRATDEHVADCPGCLTRIGELREARRLLRAVGTAVERPPHDVAQQAMRRLRVRSAAIANVNEVLAAFQSMLQGMRILLGGSRGRPQSARGDSADER